MVCNVCGANNFTTVEYRTGSIRAPAFECARCKALSLDESAAGSREELDSVRIVAAKRAVIANDLRRPDEQPPSSRP